MDVAELSKALEEAEAKSKSLLTKDKSRTLHAVLDSIAHQKGYQLSLRKSK